MKAAFWDWLSTSCGQLDVFTPNVLFWFFAEHVKLAGLTKEQKGEE